MCLRVSDRKKYEKTNNYFASLKSLKNGVGSGSISQRYGSGDPDPHQNVSDTQHCDQALCKPLNERTSLRN
jgi:hypothetical protein